MLSSYTWSIQKQRSPILSLSVLTDSILAPLPAVPCLPCLKRPWSGRAGRRPTASPAAARRPATAPGDGRSEVGPGQPDRGRPVQPRVARRDEWHGLCGEQISRQTPFCEDVFYIWYYHVHVSTKADQHWHTIRFVDLVTASSSQSLRGPTWGKSPLTERTIFTLFIIFCRILSHRVVISTFRLRPSFAMCMSWNICTDLSWLKSQSCTI